MSGLSARINAMPSLQPKAVFLDEGLLCSDDRQEGHQMSLEQAQRTGTLLSPAHGKDAETWVHPHVTGASKDGISECSPRK